MKKLHEFTVYKETEIEVTVKDENDKDVVKKEKKREPFKYFIAKPTRNQIDEADFFYAQKFNEAAKAGLLTRALLAKRYSNDGGSMSEPDKEQYVSLYTALFTKENEYKSLAGLPEDKQDKEKIKKVTEEIIELQKEIQDFEATQMSLYDQTAESWARNKTILWWVLFLSYKYTDGENFEPVFKGQIFEEKDAVYGEIWDSEDSFQLEVVNKFVFFVSFWYTGRANKPEDFAEIAKRFEPES